ncbi:MAG: F0F1 ATP synthase subunit delta [Rhodobacteraceae bacterium]|nr:F0F1 ATP synthase subunit delta [Paracoccaceae bacterium]
MTEPASISAGIAARYAAAVFDLATETGAMAALEADTEALGAALEGSADLRAMVASPVIGRDEQGRAMAALAARMGLSPLMTGTLGLMAANRRLFVLAPLVAGLRARIAEARGEVTAEVAAARALTAEEETRLAATLSGRVGRTVKLKTTVDAGLIGGLVVKVGSKMVDTTIRSRLAALQNAMKGVG